MDLSEFDFPFDPSLIASQPLLPRDQARMLVLDPLSGSLAHHIVADLPDHLVAGDVVVVNDTKVRSARVPCKKRSSGAPVDVLFVREEADRLWEVLMKGKWKEGDVLDVGADARLLVKTRAERTVVQVEGAVSMAELFERHGRMPLPPYIKRAPDRNDREWYQTVFARKEGAIAAPTAGLHFTPDLLSRLEGKGIGIARVTLHVGIGTFKPVTAERVEEHRMGVEWVEVDEATVQAIQRAKQAGRKTVAVGTTVVRALESAAAQEGGLQPYRGETGLFIVPGFSFRVVDALLTNFHLPRTTLLMLVSAFGGKGLLRQAYQEAVARRYRFYSYGDAMLIRQKAKSEGR